LQEYKGNDGIVYREGENKKEILEMADIKMFRAEAGTIKSGGRFEGTDHSKLISE